nr:hypothetical protein [Tanacetum cinerariifolium]
MSPGPGLRWATALPPRRSGCSGTSTPAFWGAQCGCG